VATTIATYADPVPSAPFVVPPLLLVLLLAVSAVAKVRDPADTAKVFRQLLLPVRLNHWHVPRLLPYGELVLAAALVLAPGRWYLVTATVSLLLFVAYLAVVIRGVRLPYPLTCGCFGRLGLGWITRRTVWRNAWLVVVALVTWVDAWRGDDVLQRLRHLDGSWWWLAMTLLAMIVTGVIVHNETQTEPPLETTDAVEELPDDEYPRLPIPYAVLDGPEGPHSVWQLSDAAARLLVFCDPADPETGSLDERVARWAADLPAVEVHVVGSSSWERLGHDRPTLAGRLLGDADGTLRDRLQVPTPGAVILGTDRLLAGGPVAGFDEIDELVAEAARLLRTAQG
jgi:hypothetical protein